MSPMRTVVFTPGVLAALALSALRASADRAARFVSSAEDAVLSEIVESTVEAVEGAARVRLSAGEVEVVRAVVVAFHAGGQEAGRRVWNMPRLPLRPRTPELARLTETWDRTALLVEPDELPGPEVG